jgi:hypothetical protein
MAYNKKICIRVGEIPKLIVTASIEPPPVSLPSPSSGTTATSGPCQNQQQNGSIPLLDRCSPHSSPSKSASDAAAASNPTVKTIDIKLRFIHIPL